MPRIEAAFGPLSSSKSQGGAEDLVLGEGSARSGTSSRERAGENASSADGSWAAPAVPFAMPGIRSQPMTPASLTAPGRRVAHAPRTGDPHRDGQVTASHHHGKVGGAIRNQRPTPALTSPSVNARSVDVDRGLLE
jgi:hypothetical protein